MYKREREWSTSKTWKFVEEQNKDTKQKTDSDLWNMVHVVWKAWGDKETQGCTDCVLGHFVSARKKDGSLYEPDKL